MRASNINKATEFDFISVKTIKLLDDFFLRDTFDMKHETRIYSEN